MQIDTVRAMFTYGAALIVVIGGGFMLFLTYSDPQANNLMVMVGGFVGSALTFLFGQETATRSARQSTAAVAAGQAFNTNGNGGSH